MHITLVNPSSSLDEEYSRLAGVGSTLPPLGLLYLAGSLEKEGHEVVINDTLIEGLKVTQETDIVGITATTPTFYRAVETAKHLKETHDVSLIIGGPHITAVPSDLNEQFDYGVIGEGEKTITELVDAISKGKRASDVKGICFRENGILKTTSFREYITNLDELPYPAYHLIRLSDYRASPTTSRSYPVGDMITSRGCPFKCIFCDRHVFGNKVRTHSPERVASEFEMLVEKYGACEIRFWDDTFNINPKRVIKICHLLQEKNLGVEWSCLARINNMSLELLGEMRGAGCWQVSYGIESGDENILNLVKKNLNLDDVRKVIDMTNSVGIESRGFFMFGLPYESRETMRKTLDFALSLNLDVAQFYITVPFPGTELYDLALNSGELKTVDWRFFRPNFPDKACFVPRGLSEKKILDMQKSAYRCFYLRPRYVMRQLFRLRDTENIHRFISAGKTLLGA